MIGILSGSTQTAQNNAPQSLFHPTSKMFVQAALQKVGSGKAVVTAYWAHAVQKALPDTLPELVLRKMLGGIFKPLKESLFKDQ